MEKLLNTDTQCPLEPKHITKSRKATYLFISLTVAIVMQYLGKFDGEFPKYLEHITLYALGAQTAQDWKQMKEKAQLLRKQIGLSKEYPNEETNKVS